MKKMIFGLAMATSVMLMSSCQKDNPQAAGADSGKKPHQTVTNSDKTIPSISVTVGGACGGRVCGAQEIGSSSMHNMISITNTNQTTLPSLIYSLYERTYNMGGIEVYTRYAQFTCSEHVTNYAGTLVHNGTTGLVYATDPLYSAPGTTLVFNAGILTNPSSYSTYNIVTIGNYEGQTCGGDPNG